MIRKIYRPFKQAITATLPLSLLALTFGVAIAPALAGDPFRTENARPISNQTEQGFKALFIEGNYPQASQELQKANQSDTKDPLIPALLASIAYANEDWSLLNDYAQKTKTRANNLLATDKLRGNLYLGVGHFLEGAYLYETKGAVSAIGKVPTAISYFDKAKAEGTDDPEYNIVRGYLDLILSANLPFANIQEAVDRLSEHSAPDYLVNRGIALAYRDLKDLSQAISYANLAFAATNRNPELHYLKAQILHMQANRETSDMKRRGELYRQANQHFDWAYERRSQLPEKIAKQLDKERSKAKRLADEFFATQP